MKDDSFDTHCNFLTLVGTSVRHLKTSILLMIPIFTSVGYTNNSNGNIFVLMVLMGFYSTYLYCDWLISIYFAYLCLRLEHFWLAYILLSLLHRFVWTGTKRWTVSWTESVQNPWPCSNSWWRVPWFTHWINLKQKVENNYSLW